MRNGRVVVVRSSKGLWRSPLVALSAALALGTLLAGCAIVDTVDRRADFMNESVTRFRNQGILRNIVRSARDEPLSFAALSQIEGHNTSVNTFPTFPQINWAGFSTGSTGSGSSSYNVSSDFTLNPVDDSVSHAALLNPLDASTIALFSQRSGYQTNLLYLLFFDKIRIADAEGRVLSEFNRDVVGIDTRRMCIGDPKSGFCGSRTMLGYTLLAYLNLRFNLEKGAVAGQGTTRPRAQICFERGTPAPGKWSDLGARPTGGRISLPARAKAPAGKTVSYPSYCDEEGTWLPATAADAQDPRGAGTKQGRERNVGANYVIYDARHRVWIELSTSSAWGIYQFLGTLANGLLHENIPPVRLIQPGYIHNPDELIVLNITKGGSAGDCFVHTEMDDRSVYCVPNGPSSRLTRIYFTFLQQLTAMQRSAVSVEPRSSRSVRGIP